MQTKKKVCAGCNEEQYIYKNINGKKYCKSCTYKLQPPKAIPKRTEKQVFKLKIKKDLLEEDKKFYLEVWDRRTQGDPGMDVMIYYPRCECCNKSLGSEPNMMYFHHILEKRNYPQYRHKEWNIAILCPDCHSQYEFNPDTIPYLQKRKELLLELRENYIKLYKNQ